MKKTLKEMTDLVHMQYLLECLIEFYDNAKKESDKYRAKLLLLDFINETGIDINMIVEYMSLNSEKFRPLLVMLNQIKYNPFIYKSRSYKSQKRSKQYVSKKEM